MNEDKPNRSGAIKNTGEINSAIRGLMGKSSRIKLSGLSGQDSIAVGLSGKIEVNINGAVGDYFGALNDGAVVILNGKARNYPGDTMFDGGLIIIGDVGLGGGMNMKGGILVIKGSVGERLGGLMAGGTIIVDGSVKRHAGWGMMGGKIIITGDIEDPIGLGGMGGNIYTTRMGNQNRSPLSRHSLTSKEVAMLNRYFEHYAIDSRGEVFERLSFPRGQEKGTGRRV